MKTCEVVQVRSPGGQEKHLRGLKNEALRIQKGKESLEDGILSSHICPPLQLKDIKIWIIQAQLRWANGNHASCKRKQFS